jgi:Ca2+-dependent lipid-binding protein
MTQAVAPGSMSGKLSMTIIEAHLTRDTDANKMDPYCKISVREQQFRTLTKEEAGKMPVWNQVSLVQKLLDI